MGGRGRLRSGLERVCADHRSELAQALRREFLAIVSGLAVGDDPLLLQHANRVARLTVRAREAARNWTALVEKRRAGKGRRPSAHAVERAARRAHLDDQSAALALDRLRALAGDRNQPLDLARAIQAANERAEREATHGDGR